MQRMNGFDAFMIHNEDLNAIQHTLKIAILDPSTASDGWSFDRMREELLRLPQALPCLGWKYLKVPFEPHHPVWVADPDFDVDYHLRHIACPAPGDNRALCELIAQIYVTPLDHRRPLWMMWTIEGLQGGKFANVMMIHHAYTDGTGALLMMQRYFKSQPGKLALLNAPLNAPPLPGKARLLLDGIRDFPGIFMRTIPKVAHGILATRRLKQRYLAEGKPLPPNPITDQRDSPVNDVLSACRSFVFETFDLDRVRRISKQHQVTVNDLLVACVAGTYRRFMIDKGHDPDTGPLVTVIPFSQRPPPEVDDGLHNYTTAGYLALPVHIADPTERLHAARLSANQMKEYFNAARGADINSIMDVMPAFGIRALNRSTIRKHGKGGFIGNALISNVAGPRKTLYMGELKLDNWISTGQLS